MTQGHVKEVFPGGNTSLGFFSFYDQIIKPDATRIFIIKGGPGVGKSSFMKAIAAELNERGYDTELHHCSSDNNSLDAVVFPQIKVALIDGTSPHIVDPRNPGAVDEILHLGDYWNEPGMRRYKREIIESNKEVGRLFRRAYQFLKAAKLIQDDLENINREDFNYGLANQKAADLIEKICGGIPIAKQTGVKRSLFASAITPDGFRNYLATILNLEKVFAISGASGTGKATLLNKIAQAALERGFDCEAYYCPFDPVKIEHLVIADLNVGFTTAVKPHLVDLTFTEIIDMNECLGSTTQTRFKDEIAQDQEVVEELLKMAVANIHQAKIVHDRMEEFYLPHMDFAAIGELRRRVLDRILAYASEQDEISQLINF